MRAQVVVIGGGAFGASCFYHLDRPGRPGRPAPRAGDARIRLDRTLRRRRRDSVPRRGPGRPVRVVHPRVPVARARARAPVRPSRLPPARPHGGGREPASTRASPSSGSTAQDARVIDPAEIGRIVPALRVDDLAGALWGPSDGYVDAVRYCEILTALGRAGAARVLQGRRATGLRLRGGRVTGVEAAGETIECDTVVNASGAWARRLGSALGLTLPVDGYRRQLVQFEPPRPLALPVPMIIDYVPGIEREGLYFRDDTPARDRRGPPLGGARGDGAPAGSGRVPPGGRLGLRGASGGGPRRPLPGRRGLPRDRRLVRPLPADAGHAADRGADAGRPRGSTRPSGAAESGSRSLPRSAPWWRTSSRRARPP